MNVSTHALRRVRAALTAGLVVCSALSVAACGSEGTKVSAGAANPKVSPTSTGNATGSPSPTGTERALTEDQAERRALVPAAKVTWDKAAGTATGEIAGSRLLEIDLTRYEGGSASPAPSPGTPEWATEVATDDGTVHRVRVDAVTGKVLRSRQESGQDADDKQEVAERLRNAKVTPEQAVATATGKKQGTVTDVHLDGDDGALIWSVDIVDQEDWSRTTVDVDAVTGEFRREEVDRD
ncbi:PepSY domain-containing protein [Streptomyces sp. NPDC058423]|uniref:PepSY domain-containing protein n=1 Tax=unclassified Streptomyces TaxID=2593676 RepID=UPI003668470B